MHGLQQLNKEQISQFLGEKKALMIFTSFNILQDHEKISNGNDREEQNITPRAMSGHLSFHVMTITFSCHDNQKCPFSNIIRFFKPVSWHMHIIQVF